MTNYLSGEPLRHPKSNSYLHYGCWHGMPSPREPRFSFWGRESRIGGPPPRRSKSSIWPASGSLVSAASFLIIGILFQYILPEKPQEQRPRPSGAEALVIIGSGGTAEAVPYPKPVP